MKKITLIFALVVFATGFGQRAEQSIPSLEWRNVAPVIQSNEISGQVQSLRSNEEVFSNYLQDAQNLIQSNQIVVDQIVQQPAMSTVLLEAADRGITHSNPVVLRQSTIDRLEGAPCSYSNPSNGWENGYNYTGAFGAVENDFIVEAGVTFDFNQIVYNTFIAPGETVVSVDVEIKEDAGGVPGAVIASFPAVAPTSQTIIGGNFGFDGSEVVLDMPPVTLEEGTYWVALNNGVSSLGGPLFWEITTATMVGSPMYQNGTNPDPAADGVYLFAGDCSTGSGGPCSYDNPSNGWENGYNYTGAFGAVENDFIVEAGVTFDFDQITYNTFIAPGETVVSVDVEIKEDAGGVPGAVIASFPAVAPTSQTIIGGNFGFDGSEVVLDMPPVTLEEGTYWVALNNGVSSLGGPLFWEITTATMVGSPMYQNGTNPDPAADGVYAFAGQCNSGNNATVINFDPTAAYIGYMNVFETPANGGGYVFGSPWGVPDLKTVVDPTPVTGSVTLYPNFNTYDDNPTDPFWVDQTTGLGNKTMEANTYVDDPSLAQQELLWTGYVISNTIDPSYNALAFIKVFNADFSVLKIETAPLVQGEFFEVSYTNVEPGDTFVQYGWFVTGLNASSANETALGNVVIGTQAPGCGDFTYVNEVPTGGGPPAQIFPDFPDFTSIAVDDVFFTGDAGLICSIDIEGRYTEGAPGLPGDPNGAVQLTIYNDDNGVPGSVRYEETFPGSVDADGDANFTLEPSQVIEATLNPDTRYWISVAVVMEFGLGGQWFWGSAEDTNDNAALWQNPGGGFGVCPTWGTFADCGVGGGLGPDLLMDVNLVTTDPLTYDVCYGARPIECGDTVSGDTLSATTEDGLTDCGTSITAPGVWYVFEDNSGLESEVLLSTCDQADYDTKLYVFTGSCGDLVCIDGNDDTTGCGGFTTELEFLSDGNSTYYILVAGFSSATGNFDLTMTCTLVPPPNDEIANAIDLLDVGCPWTDEDVAMPAATEEDGTPSGCDISGAPGVWYEFTPEINGFITGTIGSPSGVSSVTFYTAPDQSSIESDLVHVDYYQNQCLPGSSATIPVLGGQTYYCFVVNTGGRTDIIFDNCQLGTASNEIEGFEFYPNPTRERINLTAAQNIESVVLYNILGQRMMEVNVDATTTELNVAQLAAGAYLMEVTVDGQTGTYKLIKQ